MMGFELAIRVILHHVVTDGLVEGEIFLQLVGRGHDRYHLDKSLVDH